MVVIKILPSCWGDPIRLLCLFGHHLSNTTAIVISDNQPLPDVPCYELHVVCGEADVDRIREIHFGHDIPDTEASGIPFAEYCSASCPNRKSCPLARLTMQELFVPLMVDELASHHRALYPHGNN